MVQSKCKQFVGEFMGYDHVEGGTVVNKEHPDVGVLIFQVREIWRAAAMASDLDLLVRYAYSRGSKVSGMLL